MTISKNTIAIANAMPSFSAIVEANVKVIRADALAKLTKKFADACNDYPQVLETYNFFFKESCLYDIKKNGGMTIESLANAHENAIAEALHKAEILQEYEPYDSQFEDIYESSRAGK